MVNDSKRDDTKTNLGQKRDGKSVKIYILCGFISTWILCEVLMQFAGGICGFFLNIPLGSLNDLLFGSVLGSGGIQLLNDYSMFTGIMLSLLLILFIVKPWRPYLKAFGTGPSGNRIHLLLIGLLVGFAMNGICIAAAVAMGNIHFEFMQFSIVGFIAFLVFILIQASTEELFCRGFAYQRLRRTYGTAIAIIGSSVIFSLGHIFNPGVTPLALLDIFLTGVLYALMVRYFDSIWLPMGIHTAWNFTQNILFGLPNSGIVSSYSFFGLVGDSNSGFAYDTAFGVEGTVFAVIMNVACIVIVFLWGRSRNKQAYDIWAESTPVVSQGDVSTVKAKALDQHTSTIDDEHNEASEGVTREAAPKKRWFY